MNDSSNYEAACEVRDAVRQLRADLIDALVHATDDLAERLDRRAAWAGELFAMLVRPTAHQLADHWPPDDQYAQLAAVAWRLADQLDAADPRGRRQDR